MNDSVFYFIIFINIYIFILLLKLLNRKDGFSNSTNIILLGDSILNNSKYVEEQDTVLFKLKEKFDNIHLYAEDGATIVDAYNQLDKIPDELNHNDSFVFISVGGNNILSSLFQDTDIDDVFSKYMSFVSSFKIKFNNITNIILLNLYYPLSKQYSKYQPVIKKWNELLDQNANKYGYKVLKIDELMINPTDFIYNIEPSGNGATKISHGISSFS
jgi:hypothetical protein